MLQYCNITSQFWYWWTGRLKLIFEDCLLETHWKHQWQRTTIKIGKYSIDKCTQGEGELDIYAKTREQHFSSGEINDQNINSLGFIDNFGLN